MTKHLAFSISAVLALCVALAGSAHAAVVLNEVNCEGTDWVELVNTSAAPADVSGWLLTDDPIDRDPPRAEHRLTFPASSAVPGSGSLVVERGTAPVPPDAFPFGISCGGDTIRLADGDGEPVDEVEVPELQDGADTWGRYPNGTGEWVETLSTKGAPNQPAPGGEDPPPDLAGWLFDPAVVAQVDLGLPQSSLEALAEEPEEYADGTFELATTGGAYGPLQVGIRLKGGLGSFRPLTGKAAFKVKFSHSVPGQRFLGLKTMTLNNMVQDPSGVHEALTYELYRAAGVPAPRTGYAFVRVNGEAYGLYLDIETPDEIMLRRWFSDTRHLYEGGYGADVGPGRSQEFEVDEGSDSDLSDLDDLGRAALGVEPADYSDRVAPHADLGEMTRMWAVEKYVGQWDGYSTRESPGQPNNYFLHSGADGRFSMLPWGSDQTWARAVRFDGPGGAMFERCLGDASCAGAYRERLGELPGLAESLELAERGSELFDSLGPWRAADPRAEAGAEEAAEALRWTVWLIGVRPFQLADWLSGQPSASPQPRVPDTWITKRPAERTRARRVTFRFASYLPSASFECRLDRGRYSPCGSPHRVRVGPGPHRFRVRAVEPGGRVDASPAGDRFLILRRP